MGLARRYGHNEGGGDPESLPNFGFNLGIGSLRPVYLWNEGILLPNEAFPVELSTEISRRLFEDLTEFMQLAEY